MPGWYIEKGPESDVVISSRIRLARNLRQYPFPFRMDGNQRREVLKLVKDTFIGAHTGKPSRFLYVDIEELNPVERQVMVEKHLISPDLAGGQGSRAAVISRDEKISIMVNEEDHLRLQCMVAGLQLESAWEQCNRIDSQLDERLEYAFDPNYGYLTCCPTNLGTGLRASAMLHLPALTMAGHINNILQACAKLGLAVRGLYGENSEASGNMFQISNQVTLGQPEEEIISGIGNAVSQIIEQERMIRDELYKHNPYGFEDRIWRSWGLFAHARILSTEECMKLMSDVRLGVDMGIIKDTDAETINGILLSVQPGNLQRAAGRLLNPHERDVMRAEVIRKAIHH